MGLFPLQIRLITLSAAFWTASYVVGPSVFPFLSRGDQNIIHFVGALPWAISSDDVRVGLQDFSYDRCHILDRTTHCGPLNTGERGIQGAHLADIGVGEGWV
jgi:hypothetical protein